MVSFEELEAGPIFISDLRYDLLVPVPQDLGNDRPFATCKVQFSAIAGGTILTVAMSHSVADGSATNELMRILSNETRIAQEHRSGEARPMTTTTKLGLDRSVIRNITSSIPFNISDHPAHMSSPPAAPDQTPHPFTVTSPESPVLLHICRQPSAAQSRCNTASRPPNLHARRP